MVMTALIFLMIAVGGYTRLSGSGLSMVGWRPVTGWLPPLSESHWKQEFQQYQDSPQFKKVNSHFGIEDFKGIFWAEYTHRLFGRVLGLVFFIPWLFFIITRRLKGKAIWLYLAIGSLGGFQGFIGWYMVKSGLVDRPEVSAYRLAIHLGLGGTLLGLCWWRTIRERGQVFSLSWLWTLSSGLLFLQILSGAFVSGTQAGHGWQTLANQPSTIWISEYGWKNPFENIFSILGIHLAGATCITLFLLKQAFNFSRVGDRRKAFLLIHPLLFQLALGLLTLIFYSPIRPVWLCLAHQMGAFLLLMSLIIAAFKPNDKRLS
jgi:heme a synthase